MSESWTTGLWAEVGLLMTLITSKDELICPPKSPKDCSEKRKPPAKKHIPNTSKRFDKIDPRRDDCTICNSHLTNARIATINLVNGKISAPASVSSHGCTYSTTLPRVAFNRPEQVGHCQEPSAYVRPLDPLTSNSLTNTKGQFLGSETKQLRTVGLSVASATTIQRRRASH